MLASHGTFDVDELAAAAQRQGQGQKEARPCPKTRGVSGMLAIWVGREIVPSIKGNVVQFCKFSDVQVEVIQFGPQAYDEKSRMYYARCRMCRFRETST